MWLQGDKFVPGSVVSTFPTCKEGARQQQWVFNPNGTVTQVISGLCLDTTESAVLDALPLIINTCSGAPTQQVCVGARVLCVFVLLCVVYVRCGDAVMQWKYEESTGLILSGVNVRLLVTRARSAHCTRSH